MARRAYDNWGRLVEAVVRKEQLWQLFHAPSRTPSISSIESDTTSISSDMDHPFRDMSFDDTVRSDEKFESGEHVEEELLAALLDDDDVITIGIYDVGKTIMAKRIEEMVKKQNIFDEVGIIEVGQQLDVEKIRSDMADILGIKLEEQLLKRNILIILDDVSESMKLEDLGIPFCSSEKGCKIMFMSQKLDVEVEVEGIKVVATDIRLLPNMPSFRVKIGVKDKIIEIPLLYRIIEDQQYMELSLPNDVTPGNWIYVLLKKTKNLSLIGNGSNKLDFKEFEKIKKLKMCHCSTMNHLLNSTNGGVFRLLESLYLENFTNLQEICHGPLPVESFLNLRDLKIYEMPSLLHLWKNQVRNHPFINLKSIDIRNSKILPYLFTLSIAATFVHLEELRILFCGTMKEVFLNDVDEANVLIHFPRLRKLVLHSLPSLVFFCRGIESIKFPQLQFLSVRSLPKLLGVVPGDSSFPVFISQTVEFGSLKELLLHGLDDNVRQIWHLKMPNSHFSKLEKLHICACNKLKYLFSPSIARALVILNELHVRDSLMMTEVILNVEKENEKIIFPSLEKMELSKLRSLRSFCQWKQDLELSSLKHVSISMCPEMQILTPGSLRTPNLEHFEIENEVIIEIKDLNEAIRKNCRTKYAQEAASSSAGKKKVRETKRRFL